MKLLAISVFMLFIAACGSDSYNLSTGTTSEEEITEIKGRISALMLIGGQINTFVQSDYAECSNAGDLTNPVLRQVCLISQSATLESKVEMLAELANYVTAINARIDAANTDLALYQGQIAQNTADIVTINASLSTLNASLLTVQSDVAALASRMTNAEAAIAALQATVGSLTGTLNGLLKSVEVGSENLSAGPSYEILIRKVDKTLFNGYAVMYSSSVALANNSLTAVNGSASVTFALTAHGFVTGDVVQLAGLVGSRGFTTGDLTGDVIVASAPSANSFTVVLPRNATQNGTLGGANGTVKKLLGRGMRTLWQSGTASDVAVRVTSAGSQAYNFIIRRISTDVSNNTAELCYDSTSRVATFATINAAPAGGSGNIVCK